MSINYTGGQTHAKVMAVNWTNKEVFQLISCWSEEGIPEQLERYKRNNHIYDRLSKFSVEHNIEKTGALILVSFRSPLLTQTHISQ